MNVNVKYHLPAWLKRVIYDIKRAEQDTAATIYRTGENMVQIALLAIDGCLSSSIANLIDAFTIANLWHRALTGDETELFSTRIVSHRGRPIDCSSCIRIQPHHSLEDEMDQDYLILPALLPVPETKSLRSKVIIDYIRDRYSAGVTIASVCTGAFLLAETGLLNGKTATTNWQFEKKFRHRYPQVKLQIEKRITEEGNLICSGAASSIMNLALEIIKRQGPNRLVSAWSKAMLVDPNTVSQAPYPIHPLSEQHGDKEIKRVEHYMRNNLSGAISIDRLAATVCLSPRHFKRRFRKATGESPLGYLQKLRIQAAREMLENSLDPIEEITRQVGYEDSSTFRRLFKRHTSLSPREYRDRFLMLRKS